MDTKISEIIRVLFNLDVGVTLTRPEPQFGDFATSVALQLAKRVGKNPREIAEQIVSELKNSSVEASVAGPGFINIRLNDEQLLKFVGEVPHPERTDEAIVIETN